MSAYHYYVALDSILLACSTTVVAFATSGRHFWKTYAGLPRFFSTLTIFINLGIFLGYQILSHWNTDFPEWIPPDIIPSNDSALLLPVSCFLDRSLVNKSNTYAPHRLNPLNDAQLDRIERPVKTKKLPQTWIFLCLVMALLMGIYASRERLDRTRRQRNQNVRREGYWLQNALIARGVILLVCLATKIFCAVHIASLRNGTRSSG